MGPWVLIKGIFKGLGCRVLGFRVFRGSEVPASETVVRYIAWVVP